MPKRTPEDACVEYAIAAGVVREQDRIISNPANDCVIARDTMIAYGRLVESNPQLDLPSEMPSDETCLTKHWQVETYGHGDEWRERPVMAFDAMCVACKVRLKAFEDRRTARKRLGAAKRSIEAVGKRLNKETASA